MTWGGWSPGFSQMYPARMETCKCGEEFLKTMPRHIRCNACAKEAKRARDIKSKERVEARRGK
jgi:hypothetical protein